MTKKRDTHTYALFQDRRKVYIGYTSDLAGRLMEQHARAGKASLLMTESGAAQREEHGGENPKYNNKTSR